MNVRRRLLRHGKKLITSNTRVTTIHNSEMGYVTISAHEITTGEPCASPLNFNREIRRSMKKTRANDR